MAARERSAAARNPMVTTKDTKSAKKNCPVGLYQDFVIFALFVVKKFSQQ
jgi:hypothetical protein